MDRAQSIQITILTALALAAAACSKGPSKKLHGSDGRVVLYYRDPMHPAYRSNRPGTAPDCGMPLEPVYAETPASRTSDGRRAPEAIHLTPAEQSLIGLKVEAAKVRPGGRILRTAGKVFVDETRLHRVNAPIDGWIRKTYPNSVGDRVHADQELVTFFTRDSRPAVQSYLFILDRLRSTGEPVDGPRTKIDQSNLELAIETLTNMGFSQSQIREIERTRTGPTEIELRSPGSGFIIARNVSPGQRFSRGEELYRIADLGHVWVLADVVSQDTSLIRSGAAAKVTLSHSTATLEARISDALPQFDDASRTLKVRLEVDNPGFVLKPGMLVDVEIAGRSSPGLTVPVDAVLNSGRRRTVFVDRGDGNFEPRMVETGWQSGELVQITKGLTAGETVVVAGHFLLDSEARMKESKPLEPQ